MKTLCSSSAPSCTNSSAPGRVFGSNAVMQLGQRRFSPDVSVLLAASYGRIRGPRVIGPMDLAVESVDNIIPVVSHGRSRAGPIPALARWVPRFVTGRMCAASKTVRTFSLLTAQRR